VGVDQRRQREREEPHEGPAAQDERVQNVAATTAESVATIAYIRVSCA
jgi:hypothetical protein